MPEQDPKRTGDAAPEAPSPASFHEMHPSDVAAELEDLHIDEVRAGLRGLSGEKAADVIAEFPRDLQTQLIENMRIERVSEIIPEMDSDDAADALGKISPERLQDIMQRLSADDVKEIEDLLVYPDDSAGGIMQTEIISVDQDFSLAEAREAIRRDREQDEDSVLYVYAVDSEHRLKGVLKLRDLLFRDLRLLVKDVMLTEVGAVDAYADQEEIANLFQKYNYFALPVVDSEKRLVGIVTSDDVMDVIQEEATEDMHRMVGLTGEESIATPWKTSFKNRMPWLVINLGTAFLAAWIVSLFEDSIQKYAVLAIFLPIVAGQGGNAGSQTLTIVVRSLATGDMESDDWRRVLMKEFLVSLMTGLGIGLLVGLVSWLWKDSVVLGVVVFAAMALNMVAAALSGVLVPISLKALKVDPALASSIMVTTVTDVVGFFLFLSLATLALSFFSL